MFHTGKSTSVTIKFIEKKNKTELILQYGNEAVRVFPAFLNTTVI